MKNKSFIIIFLMMAWSLITCTGDKKPADISTAHVLENYTQAELDALEVTTVLRSADSPTGYYVTFRHKDPEATRVRIYGEWKFTDAAHASRWTSLNASPEEWKNGYFMYTSGRWTTSDMTFNEKTGVWSHTIPLPCGTFNYCFYTGGADTSAVDNVADAVRIWDLSNPPLLYDYEADNMNRDECLSNIYVPYDKVRQSLSLDFSVEAPRTTDKGATFFETVSFKDTIVAPFGIYLPYGYDSLRAEPYPIMVLLHGGGGVESAWFNLGTADNILDNMIAGGFAEPMIVVTPNATDLSFNRPLVMDLILNAILPYMEENYNISRDAGRRAMAGLSAGSRVTTNMLYHNTTQFGYYGIFSGGLPLEDIPVELYDKNEVRDANIFIGCGWYDTAFVRDLSSAYLLQEILAARDIPFITQMVFSGHTWTTWRQNLAYWIANVLWK